MNTENHYQETDLGNISLNPRGEYNPEESYEYLDLVVLEGGSYVCIAENGTTITGISPESGKTTQYWQVITIPGDLTPEYVSMHDRVVNLSEQVGADAEEVRTAEQNVSGMELNVTQMQEQTRQSAEAAEQSKDSSAGYAASADASRQAAEESKQNIDAQVTGFDIHVAEKTEEAENDIEAARIAANKAIIAQQEQSVNEVARAGIEAISTSQSAAQTATEKAQAADTSEKNAAASETAAKISEANATKMAEQVAADKEQVANDRTAVENAKQEMTESSAQIEKNTQGISELKGDLVELEDVTTIKSSEEQLVDVEFETITNAIAYSSSVGASTYTNSNQNCDTIKATVVGGKEYEIRYQTNNNKYALGYIISDANDKSIEVYFNESLSAWVTETKRIVMPDNAKTIWITDLHSASYPDAYIKGVLQKVTLEFKAYTKPEVDELFKTAKKETEEAITSIVNPKRCKILINFDAPTAFVTDGRFALCKKYRLPFTVNVTVNSATSIGYPDSQYGHDYIDEILSYGGDFALYSSYGKPAEDASIYNGGSESVSLFEEYIQKALDAAETIGIYHPVAWFSRYQRTGTAMNQALINKGFKICRGYKYGTNESRELFIDRSQFSSSDPTRFNVSGGYELAEDSTVSVMKAHIDEAIEQGKDFSVFCHKICADGETPRQGVGTTAENLESVLLYIRQKIDAGLCEAVTFRDYYTELYPSDGMARNYGNAYSRMLFKISG